MSKDKDVEDLLGAKPAKKTKAKAEAPAAPAKKTKAAAKAEAPAAPAKKTKAEAPAERPAREPVVFEEGEREELAAKVKKLVKKPINSRELAEKLGIATRKLRRVLYSMSRAGEITLESGDSRVAGMTVSPA